jgi:exonuclease III
MRKDKRKGIIGVLNLATWNVRGLETKEIELVYHLKERKINIAAITETIKKLKETKEIGDYTMIYSGVPRNRRAYCGVALLIDKEWKTKIRSYIFINEGTVIARFKINRGHLTVIGVCAPEEGKTEDTEILYEELQKQINTYNKQEYVIITGGLNARVGHNQYHK